MDEINAARKISQLVLDTTDIEYCFHCAEQELHRHQAKLNSLTEAAKAEKSLLEIVEHLEEQNEEDWLGEGVIHNPLGAPLKPRPDPSGAVPAGA